MFDQTVLVVEDSIADRVLYRHALKRVTGTRFHAVEVDSVEGALDFLAVETPDCILLDYVLVDGTGLDLLHALHERHGGLPYPVVMITGEGNEAVAVEAMKAGVTDYAIKGYASIDSLARAITHALGKARLQEELARRAGELEQLAYVVSHDLRAPLRTVHQNADLLGRSLGDQIDENSAKHLRRILEGTRRMESLIAALTGYCRLGAAPIFGEVELDLVVHQALADLDAEMLETGAAVEVGELPVIWGDELRLRQLFQNLIANALKFHGDQPPVVTITAEPEADRWQLTVRDRGPGIDESDLDRIFEVFQRLPSANDIPGTGIGLAICQRIVQQHGGILEVESWPGEGSSFLFSLEDAGARQKDDTE